MLQNNSIIKCLFFEKKKSLLRFSKDFISTLKKLLEKLDSYIHEELNSNRGLNI